MPRLTEYADMNPRAKAVVDGIAKARNIDPAAINNVWKAMAKHPAVMEQFARESAMGFQGTLVADERRLVESAEMGYLVCVERTRGMSQAGDAIQADIRATTVFRKEDGQWRAVHHHTDRF